MFCISLQSKRIEDGRRRGKTKPLGFVVVTKGLSGDFHFHKFEQDHHIAH